MSETYFCYYDASCKNNRSKVGFIIKNNKGNIVCQKTHVYNNYNDSYYAEILALNQLLEWLIENNFMDHLLIVCGDCKSISEIMNRRAKCNTPLFYKDVFKNYNKLKSNNQIIIKWISRKDNKEADKLSKIESEPKQICNKIHNKSKQLKHNSYSIDISTIKNRTTDINMLIDNFKKEETQRKINKWV